MDIVRIKIDGKFKYYGNVGFKYYIADKVKGKTRWIETILTKERVKKSRPVKSEDMVEMLNQFEFIKKNKDL